jgi:hypothetical protein
MTANAYLAMCCLGMLAFLIVIPLMAACMLSSRISERERDEQCVPTTKVEET